MKTDLIIKAQTGCRKSQGEIVKHYSKLCHKLAYKYPSIPHDEAFQIASISILKAINTFNPERAEFFTWVYNTMRYALSNSLRSSLYSHNKHNEEFKENVNYELTESTDPIYVDPLLVKSIIETCCEGLDTKSAKIVTHSWGVLGCEKLSNQECCKRFGYKPADISNTNKRFLTKANRHFSHLKTEYAL